MLDKKRVNNQIAEITALYTNGRIAKLEALEAMISVVDCEISNYILEAKENPMKSFSDYRKAKRILCRERRILAFKDGISFGDIVNQ